VAVVQLCFLEWNQTESEPSEETQANSYRLVEVRRMHDQRMMMKICGELLHIQTQRWVLLRFYGKHFSMHDGEPNPWMSGMRTQLETIPLLRQRRSMHSLERSVGMIEFSLMLQPNLMHCALGDSRKNSS
jgi:hypothetical protein